MTRRRVSLGMFGIFGRSRELRDLDDAFRAIDVHPKLVPEAVKLTMVNLIQDRSTGEELPPYLVKTAAELVGYCMVGPQTLSETNSPGLATAIEQRIEAALEADDSLDAQLVLLTLEARIIQPSIVQRYELESASD